VVDWFDETKPDADQKAPKKQRRWSRTPEGKVKNAVNDFLDAIDAFPFMPMQSGMGKRAVDFIVCWRSVYVAIETKAPGRLKKVSTNQLTFLRNVIRAGGWAFLIDDVEKLKEQWAHACRLSSIPVPDICFTPEPPSPRKARRSASSKRAAKAA
jgi:hypothetical protein